MGGTRLNLRGLRLTGASAPPDERMLVLALPPDGEEGTHHRLVLELMTNQWNLLLVRRAAGDAGTPAGGAGERRGDSGGAGGEAGGGQADGGAGSGGPAGDRRPDGVGSDEARPGEARSDDAAWRIRTALWPREPGDRVLRQGRVYRPPAGRRRWQEEEPSAGAWRELLGDVPPGQRRGAALREVAWLSSVNVGWVLGEAAGGAGSDAEAGAPDRDGGPGTTGGADALEAARRRYLELRRSEREAWVLEREPGLQPYVHALGREDGGRRVASLLAGMEASLRREEGWRELAGLAADEEAEPEPPEVAELREALEARESRLRRRVEALERELEEGEEPEALRETANLILARLGEVERGASEAELEGFGGDRRSVELDPTLSPSENADRYYERAKKRERAREKIPREIESARRERERVEEARRALEGREEPPDEEEADRLWELAGGRPEERGPTPEEEQRLPYRVLETSGGLEVRVGKGAKSNEELTFHHSHTEDVWMHARQVPGAHVIVRWGHREGNPPKRDLLEAAVAAAVHSDARHSGTVAVDWTRRKYVRSPRKSPPGLVVPRNIETLFVEPDEALVEKMRRRARR